MGGPQPQVFDCPPAKRYGDEICDLDPQSCSTSLDVLSGLLTITNCCYQCADGIHCEKRVRVLWIFDF